MLQEGNKSGGNRDNLLGRYVHILHVLGRTCGIVTLVTAGNMLNGKGSILLKVGRNLSNIIFILIHSRQIINLVSCLSIYNLPVRSFQESVLVNTSIDCKRNNQTNVWSFRSFDRTHATVVSVVNVTNLNTCTVTRKSTRSQGVQTALVGQLSQGINLIHELRKLT